MRAIEEDDGLEADDAGGDEEPACRLCGCTENSPCPGGCAWVPDPEGLGDLCSACLDKVKASKKSAGKSNSKSRAKEASDAAR